MVRCLRILCSFQLPVVRQVDPVSPSNATQQPIFNLELARNLHALLQLVSDGPLPGSSALGERNAATERTSCGTIAYPHDADVGSAGNGGIASHARRHLNRHVELSAGGERDALNTKAGNIFGDSGRLHGGFVGLEGVSAGNERGRWKNLRHRLCHQHQP